MDGQVQNGGWLRFDDIRLAEERGACFVELRRPDLAEAALTEALGQGISLRRRGIVEPVPRRQLRPPPQRADHDPDWKHCVPVITSEDSLCRSKEDGLSADETPDWERSSAAAVHEQVCAFVRATDGRTDRLSRVNADRIIIATVDGVPRSPRTELWSRWATHSTGPSFTTIRTTTKRTSA